MIKLYELLIKLHTKIHENALAASVNLDGKRRDIISKRIKALQHGRVMLAAEYDCADRLLHDRIKYFEGKL